MVGAGWPEVKGTLVALEPEKAGAPVVAEGSGRAVVASGLRMLFVLENRYMIYGEFSREGNVLVDDVHDAVGDEDVGNDDFSCVDEYGAVHDGDGHVTALDGLETGVVF